MGVNLCFKSAIKSLNESCHRSAKYNCDQALLKTFTFDPVGPEFPGEPAVPGGPGLAYNQKHK